MHSVMAKSEQGADPLGIAKAMVYHQAALNTDGNNFRSANELGVLMARNGQLEQAKQLFKTSLRVKQMPHAWKSLAIVHQRMGEPQLAALAQNEMSLAMNRSVLTAGSTIQWYTPERFNELAPPVWGNNTEVAKQNNVPAPATTRTAAEKKPGFFSRFKRR